MLRENIVWVFPTDVLLLALPIQTVGSTPTPYANSGRLQASACLNYVPTTAIARIALGLRYVSTGSTVASSYIHAPTTPNNCVDLFEDDD